MAEGRANEAVAVTKIDETQMQDEAADLAPVGDRAGGMLRELLDAPLDPGLYLVATPIGNLADITLRALSVLARADIIYCEDTRHSAKLLDRFSIKGARRPFHDHNEEAEIARAIAQLQSGNRIAIISDAGTPLVADPGFKLVRTAAAAAIPIFSIPGASAVLTALTASGLPTDSFFFAGFLPPKTAARRARLEALSHIPGTLVFFEAPHRIEEALSDMSEMLGPRDAVMARELTKRHEDITRGRLDSLGASLAMQGLKGEIVLLVGAREPESVSDEIIAGRLAAALVQMSLKDAAKAISDELGVPKSRVYGLGIKAKDPPS